MAGPIPTLLAAFFTALPLAGAQDGPTQPPRLSVSARLELAASDGPKGLVLSDVDKDGSDELIVVTEKPGRIRIWRGLQAGLAPLPVPMVAAIPDYCIGPVVMADGTLVLASRVDEQLLLEQLPADMFSPREDGRPVFEPVETRIDLGALPRAIAVGQASWSEDGEQRIAVVTEGPLLHIYRGTELEFRGPLLDTLPTAVAFAEGGLIVASQGAPGITFYTVLASTSGNGEPTLVPGAQLITPGIPRDLAVLDLDRDGTVELISLVGARTAYVIGLESEGGLGPWFAGEPNLPEAIHWPAGALPVDLTTHDITGDGFLELIATHLSDQTISVLGDFSQAGPAQINPLHGGAGPLRSELGDLNGDGLPDLAIANPQGSAISVFFGNPSATAFGRFAGAPHHASVPAPHSMVAGDFNGNGRADLAILSALENRLGLLYGAAPSQADFEPLRTEDVPPESDELATGDLDGDGRDDVVMLSQTPAGTRLFALSFQGPGTISLSSDAQDCREGSAILLVDFDGNGRDEVLVSDAAGRALLVFAATKDKQGNHTLVLRSSLALDYAPGALTPIFDTKGERLKGIAVGLDGDKGPGIGLLSLQAPPVAATKLAAGLAPFALVAKLPTPRPVQDLVGADIDADGFTDIAALMQGVNDNQPGVVLVILAPNANGRDSWTNMAPLLAGPKAFHLLAKDQNGDGAAEIFVSSQYAYRVDTWVGVPGGAPAPSWRLGAHRGCMDLALADIDGDGTQELIVSNNHSSDVSVLRIGQERE